jgi:integrase
MKTSKPFRVPLSDRAMAILDEARRMSAKEPTDDSFVFMGAVQKATQGGPRKPLSGMSLAMMLRRLDPDITVHGFRTSFRNWCSEEAEIEFAVAETSLSHLVGSKASRAYARSDLLERRRPLMESWSRYVGGVAKSNVLPLTRARRA